MAPECDLGLNPPSSQRPNCQTLQEQTLHSRTLSPFAVTPNGLLTESTEPVEGSKGSLDQSRSMDQEEKRDVPMHVPKSQEVLPFGITNKESLAERPTDREYLLPENRDVPMHLPRSQEVLPFGITNKESLAEGPTDREDLMRPTSSSTTSHENEK